MNVSAWNRSDDWITPKWIIDRFGPFDLDPCACDPQPWPTAATSYTKHDDGRLLPWRDRVWLNPPYHREEIGTWMQKMAMHGRGTALVFARVDTAWFHNFVWYDAAAILFLNKRLQFHTPDGEVARWNTGAPSCLIAYGGADAGMLRDNGLGLGRFVCLNNDQPRWASRTVVPDPQRVPSHQPRAALPAREQSPVRQP